MPGKRFALRWLLSLAVLALVATGCGGSAKKEKKDETSGQAPQTVSYFHVEPGTAVTLHGNVTYRGPKPLRNVISMDAESACVQMHAGKPVQDEQVLLGQGGGVANAFVYIKTGLEGKKFEVPKAPVVLDQRGCMFTPRVAGLQAGGSLAVRNSDSIEHNVHPAPRNNREWNEGMSPGAPDVVHRFARQEVMIRVKCNLHPWMRSWIAVMEHPCFTVTGPDGSFDLKNLPPGDYTVAVWHETLGELAQPASVAPSSIRSVNFTYNGDVGGQSPR